MRLLALGFTLVAAAAIAETNARVPMKAAHENSAEASWAAKKVHASRKIDHTRSDLWRLDGNGGLSFPASGGSTALRVDVDLARRGTSLPVATARRTIPNEDWREFNRLSFWLRTDAVGFPVLTLMVTIQSANAQWAAEVHEREATHHVTVPNGKWTLVQWEIPQVARERVTSLSFRPWVNKLIADPWDKAAYEIRGIELQRVDPDLNEGWSVAPGKFAFSHSGYLPSSQKIAIASGSGAPVFEVARAADGAVVLSKPVAKKKTYRGEFRVFDFSDVKAPGTYILRSGPMKSRPFVVDAQAWRASIAKSVNFLYTERCGIEIPGVHEACHRDWQATLGDKKIIINGGWHEAGDLSQGLLHTGEATWALFDLARELRKTSKDGELLRQVVDEAKWGLDWIHKARFPGGFRIGFASLNIWTNGILGDEDDRTREALNNPNVNYIAAATGAVAYSYLKDTEPELAKKSLAIAEEDWRHAIAGVETPQNLSTPAFAAFPVELASTGIIASLELYQATGRAQYLDKARELSSTITASQQRQYVGKALPLAGFFYTGPDRQTIFHQFHRAADQAPLVALSMLCRTLPNDPEWMTWYSALAMHAEYQKRAASTTEPYRVLPAYVYKDDEWQKIAEGDRYGSSRESYRKQVLEGFAMGDEYYLRALPVWFTRRGNYGVLLSQTKALSVASRLRNDKAGMQLAERQLQWVVGQNPFAQSTMWGEGYDFAPQYSVSVGDLVGELPVGMMTYGDRDAPYWPATNSYVFKEVWIHPTARWLAAVADLSTPAPKASVDYTVTSRSAVDGSVEIALTARGSGRHTFTLRTSNLKIDAAESTLTLKPGAPGTLRWKGRVQSTNTPWIAAVVPDGDLGNVHDVVGY